MHVGRTIKRDFIERLVKTTNALKTDMVVITGDLVDLPVSQIEYDLYPLKDLNAPTYFILGNHEYFHGVGEAVEYIKQLGITPLLNEHVVIGEGDKQFNLVGLTDVIGTRTGLFPPDPDAAYLNADQNKTLLNEVLFSSGMYEEDIRELYPGLYLTQEDDRYIDYQLY